MLLRRFLRSKYHSRASAPDLDQEQTKRVAAQTERALSVLKRYERHARGKTNAIPIDVNYEDVGRSGEAQRDRDAVLTRMMIGLIQEVQTKFGDDVTSAALMAALCADRAPVPPGLLSEIPDADENAAEVRARFLGGNSPAGLINPSAVRERFLSEDLPKTLRGLEGISPCAAAMAARLEERSADASFKDRVWTIAAVAAFTDWLFCKGQTLRGISRMLLLGTNLPSMRGARRISSPLPTDKDLRVRLAVSPLLAAVLRHQDEQGRRGCLSACASHPSLATATFVLKRLTSVNSAGVSLRTGTKVVHLYLALWLERIALLAKVDDLRNAMPHTPQTSYPIEVPSDVAPGQVLTVGYLLASFAGLVSPSVSGHWYARPKAKNYLLSRDDFPGVIQCFPAIDRPCADDSAELLCTLTRDVALPLDQTTLQWVDVELVVRDAGVWRRLPIEMEEAEVDSHVSDDEADGDTEDGDSSARLVYRLWADEERSAHRFDLVAIRCALENARWAYRCAGTGLFLAGAVDLVSPTPSLD
ncbi:MAG TPA: hypothetical protein PKC15_17015 [Rhodocyclaceae bacterium]|nr:hypothetical protein [Rhodocyclaceae bacterium]